MSALPRLLVASVSLLAAACASTRVAVPEPFPMPHARTTAPDPARASTPGAPAVPVDADAVVESALALRGTAYRNGGSDLNGFDCSGFTQYVFAARGLALPRDVHDQFLVGEAVGPADLLPGDLVFFSTTGRGATHVGIAIGGGEFVHAPSSKGVVRVEPLGARYWAKRYLGARRVARAEARALQP